MKKKWICFQDLLNVQIVSEQCTRKQMSIHMPLTIIIVVLLQER